MRPVQPSSAPPTGGPVADARDRGGVPLAADESVDLPGDSWAGVVAAAPYLGNRPAAGPAAPRPASAGKP